MINLEKIILGTVQFGLNYGINNSNGKVSAEEVFEILDLAHANGITMLDTADAYGDATDLIGQFHKESKKNFNIITKFNSSNSHIDKIEETLDASLARLKVKSIYGYLYHSFDDFMKYSDSLEELVRIRERGKVRRIGVSIYTNEELETVLDFADVDIIQLPYNLLDNENKKGCLIEKAKEKGKIIHVRSIFLQGLFFKEPDTLPAALLPLRNDLSYIQELVGFRSEQMASLCLNYALINPNIDGVLIGVDNLNQLKENIRSATYSPSAEVLDMIGNINVSDERLLNPTNWQ